MLVSKASLVQQKKQQWAREREEMSHLYLPWGTTDRFGNRLQVRNQFASSLDISDHSSYEYQDPMKRQRSPSLPPIHHNDQPVAEDTRSKEALNRNISTAKRFSFYDEDCEGDTSGYGSETVNHKSKSNALHDVTNSHNPVLAWHHDGNRNRLSSGGRSGEGVWSGRSPRSTSGEEGRPRWGDRGVATGRLWEPTAPNERLPQMPKQKKGTPSWVERGLNMIENTSEVLIIDQTSSNNSGVECDRSSCNGSDEGRTFLRGQNVPIEPEIKAQRENQRMKALELQSAIKNQLEDREKRRQEEREIKMREEKLEELRLQRQQEEDRQRLEQEKRRNIEKQLLEQRKLETLKKALEDAERTARQEKEKRFTIHKQNMKVNEPIVPVETPLQVPVDEQIEEEMVRQNENISPTKSSRTYDVNSPKIQNEQSKKEFNSHQTTECNSPRSLGPGNLNLYIHSVPPISLTDSQNQFSIVPLGINGDLVSGHHSGIQLAVLVPQTRNGSICSVSLNSLNNFNDSTEYDKILTPRKYRSNRGRDACTQTDTGLFKYTAVNKANETDDIQRNIDKNYSNIDENAPQDSHLILKKDRRFRSEERYKKDLENRPKWGVNRPAAQYKKQSEKDPFYSQKRKLRHKHRTQTRPYMSQSSEDSRSPSPPTRSDRIHDNSKPRISASQSYWRNKRSVQDLPKHHEATDTGTLSQTELSYALAVNDIENKKSPSNSNMSPSKRLTLSQKFINDKYGNRKLWIDDGIKANILDNESRKNILDQINMAKRDYLEPNDQDIVKTKF